MPTQKPRILTGDTPTGRLHLGHYVGSLENRLALQDDYDCYFLIANDHAFTNPARAKNPQDIRQSVIDIATDWLAVGIDPAKSKMVIQSEVPAIHALSWIFAMLIPFNRVMKNPTIKDEIRDKGLNGGGGDEYPFGFPLYAVGQCADILAFRPQLVPVGEDQIPHLELAREVARKFDILYNHVDPHTKDPDFENAGGTFPIIQPKLGRVKRLVGTGGPNAEAGGGQLLKMSKSLNNAIYLSDDPDTIKKKVMSMYTDPNRKKATDPGETDPAKNPLWAFHQTFNPDTQWVAETQAKYKAGQIGDVDVKRKLVEILVALIDPIRLRRQTFEKDPAQVLQILRAGTAKANEIAEQTLTLAKQAIKQDYFPRTLEL